MDRWSSRAGFILATMGSAIGLGSVWKFPYEAGANGGGAFVLAYLAGLALIVVPLLLAELAIGRAGRSDAIGAMAQLARQFGRSPWWRIFACIGVMAGFLILSFYAVIGGWALSYAFDALRLLPMPLDASAAQAAFVDFLHSPWRMLAFQSLFMAATAFVVAMGIESGIEAASRLLMPVLLVLVSALAVYALAAGDARAALRFLFEVDPARFKPGAWLDAVGLGFFSIGVGLGAMITYAAYAGDDIHLGKVALITVAGDTLVSILAGLAIFPIVFQFGLDPASGPGLMFVTLPLAFAKMPAGPFIAIVFYALLFVSALVSAISLLELSVAPLIRLGFNRRHASLAAAGSCTLLGVPTILSFNLFPQTRFFERIDLLTSDFMLPLAGFGISIFAGWILPRQWLAEELGLRHSAANSLSFLLRYAVPALIMAVVVAGWLD